MVRAAASACREAASEAVGADGAVPTAVSCASVAARAPLVALVPEKAAVSRASVPASAAVVTVDALIAAVSCAPVVSSVAVYAAAAA